MRIPDQLTELLHQGVIHDVLRPLQSGKEAEVYLVEVDGGVCVAKVYKHAHQRSFKNRADYMEGRAVRDTRQQRAMGRKSRYGREQEEATWRSAEVETIYRLRDAGVRVPEPYLFVDGVLLMELVMDPDGEPAPRLVDVELTEAEALDAFDLLIADVIRMLCAGLVHGDLSDFNVLLAWDGPVIIDFPQATDAAANQSARRLFLRDVQNLTSFLGRFAPELRGLQFGEEIWELYESASLHPGVRLTGKPKKKRERVDVNSVLREIADAEREAAQRRAALGLPPPRPARAPVAFEEVPQGGRRGPDRGGRGPRGPRGDGPRGEGPRGDGPRGDGPRGDGPRGDRPPPGPRGGAPRGEDRPPRDDRGPRRDPRPSADDRRPPGRRDSGPRDDLDAWLVVED